MGMQGSTPEGEQSSQDVFVRVTDADVHAARDAWWRAHCADPAAARTATLHAQAQQIAEEFRAAHAR